MSQYWLIRFYANRLMYSEGVQNTTTRPVVRIAIAGIVLGIVAMLMSIMVVTGFRNEITGKVTAFVADFRISAFKTDQSFEETPVSVDSSVLNRLRSIDGVERIQPYMVKAGLLKTAEDIQGVVLKGIAPGFEEGPFGDKLTEGTFPAWNDSGYSSDVMISKNLSRKLRLKKGDSFLVFFIQEDRKVRKLKVCGIYSTGLSEEFDNLYLLCDIRLLQKVNNWQTNQTGGYEIFTDKTKDQHLLQEQLYQTAGFSLNTLSTRELYPQLFNWLDLQNLNVIVIITLILFVAGVTMISTMLVIIMENTREIGILKSIGATDKFIGRVFGWIAFRILLRGLITGNAIALLFAFIQSTTGVLSLPEESYYLSQVPIHFSVSGWLLVNVCVIFAGLILTLVPVRIISGIRAVKVLRFD
jgi:lipoprotein-releasing system permease protein